MKEEHTDLMIAQATQGGMPGSSVNFGGAAGAKDATRNLDAEMRKRRLAKNALLAVSLISKKRKSF